MKLLLVEDDPMVGGLLETALREAGYNVELCPDAECAELAMKVQSFDVVVLDIGLPDKSGLDFLKSLRRAQSETPVLILSARFAPPDRVLGLDLGADDYMAKPFDLDELLARLRSIIRRGQGRVENMLRVGGLELDPVKMRVTVDGQEVALQPKELSFSPCFSTSAENLQAKRRSRSRSTRKATTSKATPSRRSSTASGASSGAS